MPRFPDVSTSAGAMPASIFARLLERLARYEGDVYPFHLGDTHLETPERARFESMAWDPASAGNLYKYANPAGDEDLVEAILHKLGEKNGIMARPSELQITAGATHAFSCAAQALFNPGDEVLLLSPYWPLIRGHVLAVGARPVEVPFSQELYRDPDADIQALLESYITPRTVAVYLINPNNPDGKVLVPRQLEAIAEVAERHNLWVLSDEVYEEFIFNGSHHRSLATFQEMRERTLTAFSFSKSYAMAGLRVGYIVGPESALAPIRKLSNHSIFNVPRAVQRVAVEALRHGEAFLDNARKVYRESRDQVVSELGDKVPFQVPEAGTYAFLDLSGHLEEGETAVELLEKLASHGILLAPGAAFGKKYASWARLCYTAMPPDHLRAGLTKLASLLGTVFAC